MNPTRREALGLATATIAALAFPGRVRAADKLDAITVDYAYYNPVSLILKQNGWLDRALAANGTSVSWVLSLGSNKANQFLASGSAQFASTAGSAALLARANGVPLHTVFLYSQPEWTAIVVGKDSKLCVAARSQRQTHCRDARYRSVVLPAARARVGRLHVE